MLSVRRLDMLPDPENVFVHIYGTSENAFWLDSSTAGERGRFSFMGDASGPRGAVVTYSVNSGCLRVERQDGVEEREESIFDFLGRETRRRSEVGCELPFEFRCGFAGYLGYELKAECGGAAAHGASTPDAALILADRLLAFDHQEGQTYLLSLNEADPWLDELDGRVAELPPLSEPWLERFPSGLALRRSRRHYREDVNACKRYLTAGHSYEICLTNELRGESGAEPLGLYRALRRANPAPFSAYLRFGELAVLSSSPERFLAIDRNGSAEARPIKGTSRRGATAADDIRLAAALRTDKKSRAENVTIVDLMRNDLGRVCEIGSIDVPKLMQVETYATVHQLVSSVRGKLRGGLSSVDCVRACFPPGSMTGAPKLRTMEIIDELEGEARGVYSGAIGWFGLDGACDLSVSIRTIVLDRGTATVGAGGAIVVDSDPEDEFEEMLLKAQAASSVFEPQTSLLGRT
jgi:para-aminobenzoate synthetase